MATMQFITIIILVMMICKSINGTPIIDFRSTTPLQMITNSTLENNRSILTSKSTSEQTTNTHVTSTWSTIKTSSIMSANTTVIKKKKRKHRRFSGSAIAGTVVSLVIFFFCCIWQCFS